MRLSSAIKSATGVAAMATLFAMTAPVAAAHPFMKLGDIKGESAAAKDKGKVETEFKVEEGENSSPKPGRDVAAQEDGQEVGGGLGRDIIRRTIPGPKPKGQENTAPQRGDGTEEPTEEAALLLPAVQANTSVQGPYRKD